MADISRIRLRFQKIGRAAFISHLDLMRTFQRAFMRAWLCVRQTQGFNPHPYISIAAPLGVGASSVCEMADIEFENEPELSRLPARLTAALPEGIGVEEAYAAGRNFREIRFFRYRIRFNYPDGLPDGAADKLGALFGSSPLVIRKRTKSGEKDVDISPGIRSLSWTGEGLDYSEFEAVLSAAEPVLSHDGLIAAVNARLPELRPDPADVTRICALDADMNIFR